MFQHRISQNRYRTEAEPVRHVENDQASYFGSEHDPLDYTGRSAAVTMVVVRGEPDEPKP